MLESTASAETARQAALAAHSGAPLAAGLRAAADEASSRRVATALRRLADEVERGGQLETLLTPASPAAARLPAALAALLVAAQRTGDLPAALLQWLHDRRKVQICWRELGASLAYPALLAAVSYGVFLFNAWVLTPPFRLLFEEWNLKLPVNTRAMLMVAEFGPPLSLSLLLALAAAMVLLRVAGGPVRYWQVVHGLPLAGKLVWWTSAADCFRGLALLTARGVPLPEALALAGPAVGDPALALGCQQLQRRVEQGAALASALRAGGELPQSTAPLVQAGEQQGDLPGALLAAAELLEHRVREQALLAAQVIPPLLLACTLGLLAATLFAIIMPLGGLIQGLTWSPFESPAGREGLDYCRQFCAPHSGAA